MSNNRVLVTGGSGVIGSELIDLLVEDGATVLSIDREPYTGEHSSEVESVEADLATSGLERIKEFKPETVFHLAAVFERTDEPTSFWSDNWRDNTELTHRLFDAIRTVDSVDSLVYASSYLVYDPDVYLSSAPSDRPTVLDEDTAISPRNLCGAAKYYAEQEIDFLAERDGIRTVSARIFRVYGRGSRDVISRWVRAALDGQEISVYNGQNQFDFIHAQDVARGLFRLSKASSASGPINLSRGVSTTVFDVVSAILEEVPDTDSTVVDEGVKELYENSCADVSELVGHTDWRPEIDIESGVQDIVEYERKHPE
jgi:nucleoside-diphosphate-sugar epimerase